MCGQGIKLGVTYEEVPKKGGILMMGDDGCNHEGNLLEFVIVTLKPIDVIFSQILEEKVKFTF